MKNKTLFLLLPFLILVCIARGQNNGPEVSFYTLDVHNTILSKNTMSFIGDNIIAVTPVSKKIIFQFTDSGTIEFLARLSKTDTTTVWQSIDKSGSLTVGLEPGHTYEVSIRLSSQPLNIGHYLIQVDVFWWQRTEWIALIIALVALLTTWFLFYFFRRGKKKELLKQENEKNQARYELKAIYAQLNPHFIFNALNSIQGLINKNDISGANHYLTEFSSLLRESLRNNEKELIPLDTELKILETYLRLEQLRFHFQYKILVDESIDKNAVEIPSLLLQPLIENAIKHGVASMAEKGMINISFQVKNKDMAVSIVDNGNGFIERTSTEGLGLKLTKDRIRLFNQSFKKQPIQLYIETAFNNGTTVHLGFENWL